MIEYLSKSERRDHIEEDALQGILSRKSANGITNEDV
jgi:hypothetical protein